MARHACCRIVDELYLLGRDALRSEIVGKGLGQDHDAIGHTVGRPLQTATRTNYWTALIDDPTRCCTIGKDVVKPDNPRHPAHSGVQHGGEKRRKRWRGRNEDIGTRQRRQRGELSCHERDLLPVPLNRCITTDPKWQPQHRDSVALLSIGKHPGPPHWLWVMGMGGHYLDVMPAIAQPLRPDAAYWPDAGRLGSVVVAPELNLQTHGQQSKRLLSEATRPVH